MPWCAHDLYGIKFRAIECNTYKNKCKKNLKFSVLVGTAIKALKQAAEMKHKLSACILIPTLAVMHSQLK